MINYENIHLLFIPKKNLNIIKDYFSLNSYQKTCLNYVPLNSNNLIISMFGLINALLSNIEDKDLKNKTMSILKSNKEINFINLYEDHDLKKEFDSIYSFILFNESNQSMYKVDIKYIFRYSKYESTFYHDYFNVYINYYINYIIPILFAPFFYFLLADIRT